MSMMSVQIMPPNKDRARTRLGKNNGSPLTTTKVDINTESRVGRRKTIIPTETPLMSPEAVKSAVKKARAIPRIFTAKREITVTFVEGKATRRTIL